MPFLMLVGMPCSGKTTVCDKICSFLSSRNMAVKIVNDDQISVNKASDYSDPNLEKVVRSSLKSAVQRFLSKTDIVVLDSMNYIKGFRYELFCANKLAASPQCVVYLNVPRDVIRRWNVARPPAEAYESDVLEALCDRFEAPVASSRWDAPLIEITDPEKIPLEDIYNSLVLGKTPKPNMSTQCQPMSSGSFLHDLDRVTQAVVKIVLEAQKTVFPGDEIEIPECREKITLERALTMPQLQRLKRQFISYTKAHPIEDNSLLTSMFVQFINRSFD